MMLPKTFGGAGCSVLVESVLLGFGGVGGLSTALIPPRIQSLQLRGRLQGPIHCHPSEKKVDHFEVAEAILWTSRK